MSTPDMSFFGGYPLQVSSQMLASLRELHAASKFEDLPGHDTQEEQARCTALVNDLIDRLIAGIQANPRKSWVLEQCVETLEAACREDTEARERFGPYLERILDILRIESSDGMFSFYLALGGVMLPDIRRRGV
jgi:hypothetical protein